MTESATRPPSSSQPAAKLPPRWFSRTAWAAHRALFSVTGGRLGTREATEKHAGTVHLRTTGRHSGKEHGVMLSYIYDGEDIVLKAMNGGADPEPAWWLNLQAHPDAWVDLRGASVPVTARAATAEERARLWPKLVGVTHRLENYAGLRSHETAVVLLEPRDEP